MPECVILVTNNPQYLPILSQLDFINGSSWDVLVEARDMIHKGWCLLSHPLYGNLRPYQQPFRSILLSGNNGHHFVDACSLSMIEHALSVYRACSDRLMEQTALPLETEGDYAMIDFELMKFTLEQYNLSRKSDLSLSSHNWI